MKQLTKSIFIAIAALAVIVSVAFAQDYQSAQISVTAPVEANLTLTIGGKQVSVPLPVTISFDGNVEIDEAGVVIPTNRVGDLAWEITGFQDLGSVVQQEYREPMTSTNGTFMKVLVDVTNLGDREYEMDTVQLQAIASSGKVFEVADRWNFYGQPCDKIAPDITETCEYLFETPKNTKISGLNIYAYSHGKVFSNVK